MGICGFEGGREGGREGLWVLGRGGKIDLIHLFDFKVRKVAVNLL